MREGGRERGEGRREERIKKYSSIKSVGVNDWGKSLNWLKADCYPSPTYSHVEEKGEVF